MMIVVSTYVSVFRNVVSDVMQTIFFGRFHNVCECVTCIVAIPDVKASVDDVVVKMSVVSVV